MELGLALGFKEGIMGLGAGALVTLHMHATEC